MTDGVDSGETGSDDSSGIQASVTNVGGNGIVVISATGAGEAIDVFASLFSPHQLWRTDGGAATLLATFASGDFVDGVTVAGDVAYVTVQDSSGPEIWRSNGTTAGTFDLGVHGAPVALGNRVYFINDAGGLSTTDGTLGGAHPVATFGGNAHILGSTGGALLLSVDATPTSLWLWSTAGGATPIPGLQLSNGPAPLEFNGKLYFDATDGVHGAQLWASDGTAADTVMLTDVNAAHGGAEADAFEPGGGLLLFTDEVDGTTPEVWSTDGTAAGTVQLTAAGVAPDVRDGDGFKSLPGSETYFSDGHALYKTDATVNGTGVAIANLSVFAASSLGQLGNTLVLSGSFNGGSAELALSDGTAFGTSLIAPGVAADMINAGGALFSSSSRTTRASASSG